jgi:hypothetical protein
MERVFLVACVTRAAFVAQMTSACAHPEPSPANHRHEGRAGPTANPLPLPLPSTLPLPSAQPNSAPVPPPNADHVRDEGRAGPLPTEFATDPDATRIAEEIRKVHAVALTLERDHMMDGGYRGTVHIIPKAPTGADRRHLEFLRASFDSSAAFRSKVASLAPSPAASPYMFLPTEVRFFRTEPKRTPSAYAIETRIAYNVIGTLMQTQESVIETMIHEVFHLNDQAHKNWAETALEPIHSRLIAKCAKNTSCLAPYAPGNTMVRGGTYYAFQPGNGPGEYAAELMVRIYRETMSPPKKPFKCMNSVNAEAQQKLTTEFFGFDPVPSCP